jgi:quercetin dioxygenase-like cupin family protein
MKLLRAGDFVNTENPNVGKIYRQEIVLGGDMAQNLGGVFGILPPGTEVQLHYHVKRESVLIIIRGEAVQRVDSKEFSLDTGDVVYILPGERHAMINRSTKDVRFIEFFTHPPAETDFIAVE